jgi:hypothetical protein
VRVRVDHPDAARGRSKARQHRTGMIQRRKRIVLFLPHRADPAQGVRVSADLTPLELLQIAAIPDQEGYECVLIDAMVEPDYMAKVMEACDGALCFASSCILGFQVAHGARVAKAVREKFPRLPIIWGGWFPSVVPERYFLEGIADAVGMGQGELTFAEVVRALDAGEDLAKVPGLAVWRDGRMVYTDHRAVVGFDKIPDVPWHLLDFEKYVALQNDKGSGWKLRHKYADPWDMQPGTPLRGFSYYSSYGCPEPCTFCCSPLVTGRRWKAIPGTTLAERVLAVHDRFKFNILRFQDANFGVHEKRSNEFCSALIAAGSPFWWNGTYEIETIARYKDPSLDLLKDSRFHMAALGAEAGSKEQQERIKKKIDIENDLESSLRRLNQRRTSRSSRCRRRCAWPPRSSTSSPSRPRTSSRSGRSRAPRTSTPPSRTATSRRAPSRSGARCSSTSTRTTTSGCRWTWCVRGSATAWRRPSTTNSPRRAPAPCGA